MSRREARQLVALLRVRGWSLEGLDGQGHLTMRSPTGERCIQFSTHLSGRNRSTANVLAKARRLERQSQ